MAALERDTEDSLPKVTIRYFASIRDAIGQRAETREILDPTTAGELIDAIVADHPSIDRLRRASRIMVNHEYAERDRVLNDGDEVALIPPVSGGAGDFQVTDQPIDLRALTDRVASPTAGAIATFAGTVRDNARGRGVHALEYEAYPEAAERALEQIGAEIRGRWDVERVAISHRTGHLAIGEVSVGIAVSSAHRAEAFEACRHAIERIKQIVPIWKKEFYEGGESWIGSESEYQSAFGRSSPPRSDTDSS